MAIEVVSQGRRGRVWIKDERDDGVTVMLVCEEAESLLDGILAEKAADPIVPKPDPHCSGRCGNQPGSIRPIRPRNCRSEHDPVAACATASATSSASVRSGGRPGRAGTGYSSANTYAATTRASRSVISSSHNAPPRNRVCAPHGDEPLAERAQLS
jgi:hypothetical protein